MTSINCELCRHHVPGFIRNGCTKDHYEKDKWNVTWRATCVDYSAATRAERLAVNLGNQFNGGDDLRKQQATARRTAGTIGKAAQQFERFLTADEVAALGVVAAMFKKLGNDLEVAARRADKVREEARKQSAIRARAEALAVLAAYLPDPSAEALHRLTLDAACFAGAVPGSEAKDWFRTVRNDPTAWLDHIDADVHNALCRYARASKPPIAATEVEDWKVVLGKFVEQMKQRREARYGTLDHFNQFRAWRAQRVSVNANEMASIQQ